jgi:hypothetical protein
MAVLYVFPASIYKGIFAPHNLDEMEIEEPEPNETNAMNTTRTAVFSLTVKSGALSHVVVTVTFTRMQSGLANPSAVSTNGAVWDYFNNDATTPIFEAKWTRPLIGLNTTTDFSIDFNVGATIGTFFATFRVDCDELSTKAECPIQHSVT